VAVFRRGLAANILFLLLCVFLKIWLKFWLNLYVVGLPHSGISALKMFQCAFSQAWALEGFFSKRANGGFFNVMAKRIFPGRPTVVKFNFKFI